MNHSFEETHKIYKQILRLIKKNKDKLTWSLSSLEDEAERHLFTLKLKDVYGFNINPIPISSLDYHRFSDYTSIGYYDGERRSISWSFDGRQPKDEYLFKISFSTGAYIFGRYLDGEHEYPTDFFNQFWLELKSYQPDYIDEVNRSLYWKLENAKDIFNSFFDILKKYQELNKEDFKRRDIERLKKQLAKLEGE